MRRSVAFMVAAVSVLAGAVPASAQENYPPTDPYPPNGADPGVSGSGGGGGDLAFTGADLALWASVAIALIAVGLVLFWLRRRHIAGTS